MSVLWVAAVLCVGHDAHSDESRDDLYVFAGHGVHVESGCLTYPAAQMHSWIAVACGREMALLGHERQELLPVVSL